MRRRTLLVILAGMAVWAPPLAAAEAVMIVTAQLDCASLPAGPSRTDCYIALSRTNRQEFEIAAGAAQRAKDVARYHEVTGQRPTRKPRAAH